MNDFDEYEDEDNADELLEKAVSRHRRRPR